jgi:hypothetical protein
MKIEPIKFRQITKIGIAIVESAITGPDEPIPKVPIPR